MARGQITIEFILILIVVLAIISTVSIPLVNFASDTIQDTGNAVLLRQTMDKIAGVSKLVSSSGCGSRVLLNIDTDQLNSTVGVYNITISGKNVFASYMLQNGTIVSLREIQVPDYISISCTGNVLNISKDCEHPNPDNQCIIGTMK